MPRLLLLMQSAFSVWMLVDAIGRPGIPRYWYWVILMPFGEWFYFFKYKIHDPDFAWLKAPFGSLLDRPASIKDLRHNAEETPSLANQVSLAQALHDADEYEEASKLFERALETDSNSCDALYGLGVSRIGLGDEEGAVEPLRRLVDIDPRHHDYDGWAKLAHALWKLERRQETIEVLSRLVKQSPRLQHRMAFAYYLGLADHRDEAQAQLATALQEFEYAPKYMKRRQRGLAKKAREMLRQLSEAS